MSEENVEIVRRAFASEGVDGLLKYLDSGIEWTTTGAFVEAASYRGHDGMRRYLGTIEGEFDDARTVAEEIIDAGELVLVSYRSAGAESEVAQRWT
jgi:ketosteroid isomerase-like protein